jgi:hypothetical protein
MKLSEQEIRKNIADIYKQQLKEAALLNIVEKATTLVLNENPKTDLQKANKKEQDAKAALKKLQTSGRRSDDVSEKDYKKAQQAVKTAEAERNAAYNAKQAYVKKEKEIEKIKKQAEKDKYTAQRQSGLQHIKDPTRINREPKLAKLKKDTDKKVKDIEDAAKERIEKVKIDLQNIARPGQRRKGESYKAFIKRTKGEFRKRKTGESQSLYLKRSEKYYSTGSEEEYQPPSFDSKEPKAKKKGSGKPFPTKRKSSKKGSKGNKGRKGSIKDIVIEIQKNLGNHFKGQPRGRWRKDGTDAAWKSWADANKRVIGKTHWQKADQTVSSDLFEILKASWASINSKVKRTSVDNWNYEPTPESMLDFIKDINQKQKESAEKPPEQKKPQAKKKAVKKQTKHKGRKVEVIDVKGNEPEIAESLVIFGDEYRGKFRKGSFTLRLVSDMDEGLRRTTSNRDTEYTWFGQERVMKFLKKEKDLYRRLKNPPSGDLNMVIRFKRK